MVGDRTGYLGPQNSYDRDGRYFGCVSSAVSVPAEREVWKHGQWCAVMMPHYKVGAEPPDHTLDKICLVGLEAGDACQRLSHAPQLLGDRGYGDGGSGAGSAVK